MGGLGRQFSFSNELLGGSGGLSEYFNNPFNPYSNHCSPTYEPTYQAPMTLQVGVVYL